MVKLIFLFRRKSGTTFQQFREYYEHNHVPLAVRLLPYFKSYKRNYIRHDRTIGQAGLAGKLTSMSSPSLPLPAPASMSGCGRR